MYVRCFDSGFETESRILGDGQQTREYRREDGPLHEHPPVHIVLAGNQAYLEQPLRDAVTFPEELLIREGTGDVFR
jgi:hypothetical protein